MSPAGVECSEVLKKLSEFKNSNGDRFRLRRLGVFGSHARGDASAQSDIDIVFETDEPNLFRTSRLRQELEALLDRHVDIVRLREDMNPRLRERIMDEARYA